MLSNISEKKLHYIRWLLAVGWLMLICSLFYDPVSASLTETSNLFSAFQFHKSEDCVVFQGECLQQTSYPLGARIFWSIIVPSSIVIILVFGHETWRRICPLSFMSQISRALGLQRKRKVVNVQTQTHRYEVVLVEKNSWLGRNHLYLQFGLLFIGLNIRILLINSDRLALGVFLLVAILCAVIVGYLYGGKSFCQYFCPMAPVQMVFTGPRGFLGSQAHQGARHGITQSMCRTVDKAGNEKSACVSCQSPCIDIDAENFYWNGIKETNRKIIYYSYLGLITGFFFYFFLYSGSWHFLASGSWNEIDQFSTIFKSGFYVLNQKQAVPKLVAAPLTLSVFTVSTYLILQYLEKVYQRYEKRLSKNFKAEQLQHKAFTICTFIAFNIFYFLGIRQTLSWLPLLIQQLLYWCVVIVSTLWLYRTLNRSSDKYCHESLANRLRCQLQKLAIDFRKFLNGRSIEELQPDEVYVLAKVLPGFTQDKRLQAYREILKEALEERIVDSYRSLEVLKNVRFSLGISDEEHRTVLIGLGIENPNLLDPQKQLTRENCLRIESYRQALELILLELVESGTPLREALQIKKKQILALKHEYSITSPEEAQVLSEIFDQDSVLVRVTEALLIQLQILADYHHVLNNFTQNCQGTVFVLLCSIVQQQQQLVTTQLLSILEILGDRSQATRIADSIRNLAGHIVGEILQSEALKWQERLSPDIIALLKQEPDRTRVNLPRVSRETVINLLNQILQEPAPLTQAASLYGLYQLDNQQGFEQARQLLTWDKPINWLVRETAEKILVQQSNQMPAKVPMLITINKQIEKKIFQQSVIRVGRSYDNDIVLSDPQISKFHAVFYLNDQEVCVEALTSAYGLRIRDKRFHNVRQRLNWGDVIYFTAGEEPRMIVYWEEMPAAAEDTTEVPLKTLEKLLLLFQNTFFRHMKAEFLIELACSAQMRVYHLGDKICQQGKPVYELLLFLSGEAKAFIHKENGAYEVGTILPGETVGELEILSRTSHLKTVVSTTDKTVVLAISANKLDNLLHQNYEYFNRFNLLSKALASIQHRFLPS